MRVGRPRTREVRAVLGAVAVGLGLGAKPYSRSPHPEVAAGEQHLAAERYELARRAFQAALDRAPGDVPAAYGLGMALAAQGRCDEATAAFDRIRTRKVFGVDARVAEAACLRRAGRAAEAQEWLLDAESVYPSSAPIHGELVYVALALGDRERAEMSLDVVDDRLRWDPLARVLRAEIDLGTPEFEWSLIQLPDDEPQRAVLDARASLCAGDPERAAESLLASVLHDLTSRYLAALRGEALRQAGRLDDASFAFDRFDGQVAHGAPPMFAALYARTLWDRGEHDRARSLLADLDPTDPDVAASRWYVDRGTPRAGGLAAVYENVRRTADCELATLIAQGAPP